MRPTDQRSVGISRRSNDSHMNDDELARREPSHARTHASAGLSDVF